MTFKKNVISSCCGSKNTVLELDKSIRKPWVKIFKDAGYFVPDNFFNAGICYLQKQGVIATGSFGTTRINVRCSGKDCENQLIEFERLLEQAINS